MIKMKSITGFLLLYAVIQGFAQQIPQDQVAKLKDMTLHIIPQAHIDLAWWWRYNPETVDVVITHTLETAFANMEKFPDYTFTYLQVPAIEPLEELYPDLFYKLRYYSHNKQVLGKRIGNPDASGSDGRLAIGSGLWCEIDGSLPCGESLVRQCLYGKRYYKNNFGIDVTTAWFQDAWTHPWTFPQILQKSGIDSYMFTRPRGQGQKMFWWESADGSRVFAYKPLQAGGENLSGQKEINDYLIELNKQYGVKDGLTLIGVGNHGGGAIKADVERMEKTMANSDSLQALGKGQPRLVFSTPARFVESVMKKKYDLPVIKDELIPTIRGAYTSVGEIKKGNRTCENLLMTWEKFSVIASQLGGFDYPRSDIFEAWKKIMLNQFHDTISGTDIQPSIEDALKRYQAVIKTGGKSLEQSLKSICQKINTGEEGPVIVIFNPLSWRRTDVVGTEIEVTDSSHIPEITDYQGNRIPYQITSVCSIGDRVRVKVVFIAENIPSFGYKSFRVRSVPGRVENQPTLEANWHLFENEFFEIEIDPSSGCLASLYDKENSRELLDKTSKANLIQIVEDFGDSEGFLKSPEGKNEFNRWTGKSWNVVNEPEISLIENGPIRTVIQIKQKFNLARFIQRINIYSHRRRIDFDLVIDWQGRNKMVKVAFPLSLKSSEATYEIPYGTIKRKSRGEEQVAQTWVDISEDDYGVSLLNDGRYGHDISENTIRLSVLRSPDRPVFSTEEKGTHSIRYALLPHQGSWQEANVMRAGYEFNNPLIVMKDTAHAGYLPTEHAFLEIKPENLVITVLKKAEDAEDIMLRFYETAGISCKSEITLSPYLTVDAVHKTDLLENPIEESIANGKSISINVPPFSIESYKLIKDIF